MMRYLILNAVFLAVAGAVAAVRRRSLVGGAPTLLRMSLVLLLLTLVFDNVIVLLNLVSYHSAAISGLRLYRAPVEDFAYTIGAILLVPVLWRWRR